MTPGDVISHRTVIIIVQGIINPGANVIISQNVKNLGGLGGGVPDKKNIFFIFARTEAYCAVHF